MTLIWVICPVSEVGTRPPKVGTQRPKLVSEGRWKLKEFTPDCYDFFFELWSQAFPWRRVKRAREKQEAWSINVYNRPCGRAEDRTGDMWWQTLFSGVEASTQVQSHTVEKASTQSYHSHAEWLLRDVGEI